MLERITHIPWDKVVYWQKQLVEKWFGSDPANTGQRKEDSINGNLSVGLGRERTYAQSTQCQDGSIVATGGGESLEGETWFSSLEITSSQRLLGRNIKIQLDISQVFYHAVSDPFPLITLYTHLNTDTHFWTHCSHSNIRGGKGGAAFCTRWKSFGRTSSCNRGTKKAQELTDFSF